MNFLSSLYVFVFLSPFYLIEQGKKIVREVYQLVVLILQALELLSDIAILESAILKLEEEFISLHFQVSQERNERRLTEYRWRHSSQPLFVCSDVVKAPVNTLSHSHLVAFMIVTRIVFILHKTGRTSFSFLISNSLTVMSWFTAATISIVSA